MELDADDLTSFFLFSKLRKLPPTATTLSYTETKTLMLPRKPSLIHPSDSDLGEILKSIRNAAGSNSSLKDKNGSKTDQKKDFKARIGLEADLK